MNIINFFYKIYAFHYHRMSNKLFGVIKFHTFCAHYSLVLMNKVLPIYFKYTKDNNSYRLKRTNKAEEIIVSLTTFPLRIDKVWLVIETLFRQTRKPDRITLWLSKEQFVDIDSLPKMLVDQQERGLEIRFVDGDIRSYKKYQYVFEENPDALVILADDDIMYNIDLVDELMRAHEEEPDVICARYGYTISRDSTGKCLSYKMWQKIKAAHDSSSEVFFGSGGGTLVQKKMMYKDFLNIALARELSPTADDIYLNAMARLKGTKIRFVKGPYTIASVKIKDNIRLAVTNIGEASQNDVQIDNVNKYYKEKEGLTVF